MEPNKRFADVDIANAGGLRFGISIDQHIAPKSFLSRAAAHSRARSPCGRTQSLAKNGERVGRLTLRRAAPLRFRRGRVCRTSACVARQALAVITSDGS